MSDENEKKIRLDVALREWGLAPSRAKAQELIVSGAVVNSKTRKVLADESQLIGPHDKPDIKVNASDVIKYVSRAGRKLEGAIKHFNLDVRDKVVLDVGQSTGGFTDCVIQMGAAKVIGIDVGHSQLHEKLKTNANIICLENCNARDLKNSEAFAPYKNIDFDWIVADVSFVSLELILPEVIPFLKKGGGLLALIKPQFELGQAALNKKGIVTDPALHIEAKMKIKGAVEKLGMLVHDIIDSDLPGQDGNREFFIYAQK